MSVLTERYVFKIVKIFMYTTGSAVFVQEDKDEGIKACRNLLGKISSQ